MADVGVVKYKVELDDKDVGKQADKTNSTLVSKFGGAAKKVGAAALAASTAVATAATAAVVDLTKQAVSAYADFEQLEGGIKKLFGDDVYTDVISNAENAFKSVGMSANDYIKNVTGFSAALINSLGGNTKEAAAVADVAMRDIADNANTYGKYTAEEIAGVYQALAKGQWQTLDNLNLGYGGTKEGMQALIKKANELGAAQGKNANLTIDSFADIVEAIHRVQTDMGIADTTINEGFKTISGSIQMVKASWDNVLSAIGEGDDAKLTQYINDLVESIGAASNNLLPTVETALMGIADLVSTLAPQIAEKLPSMITDALPSLLAAGVEAIKALAHGLVDAIPELMPTVIDVIMQLGQMIIEMAPELVKCGIELLGDLALGLAQALPELIPVAVDAVLSLVEYLLDNIDMLIDAGVELLVGLAFGLVDAIPVLLDKAPIIIMKLVEALIRNLPKLVECAVELIIALASGLIQAIPRLIVAIPEIIAAIVSGLISGVADIIEVGGDLVDGLWQGIKKAWGKLVDGVKNLGKGIINTFKSILHIGSPSKLMRDEIGRWIPEGIAVGIEENSESVSDSVNNLVDNTMENVTRSLQGNFNGNYNLPDIAGYASDLSATITASNATEIIVPLSVDGREIARASAWYMNEQLAWEAR